MPVGYNTRGSRRRQGARNFGIPGIEDDRRNQRHIRLVSEAAELAEQRREQDKLLHTPHPRG